MKEKGESRKKRKISKNVPSKTKCFFNLVEVLKAKNSYFFTLKIFVFVFFFLLYRGSGGQSNVQHLMFCPGQKALGLGGASKKIGGQNLGTYPLSGGGVDPPPDKNVDYFQTKCKKHSTCCEKRFFIKTICIVTHV